MNIIVINGPNLNFLGIRDKQIYGTKSYNDLITFLEELSNDLNVEISIYQSNSEGEIIDLLQLAYYEKVDGIILNAGAYTHYSYAIRDAIDSINIPTVEVHLSNIYEREEFRKKSVIHDVCVASFYGKHFLSYQEALEYLIERNI